MADAAGSEVVFGSAEHPAASVYIAGSVLSDHQITLVEGPATNLDLDWPALLQTINGPIVLDLGANGFLKGDLIAGGDEGDVILTAQDTLILNGHIRADRDILVEAGLVAAGSASPVSVTISKTAWLRAAHEIDIDGYNDILIDGPIGSLQDEDPP